MEMQEAIEQALDNIAFYDEVEVRTDYSGHCMYCRHCFGIVVEELKTLALFMAELGALDMEVASQLADNLCSDSMGLGTIFYFPKYHFPTLKCDDDESK